MNRVRSALLLAVLIWGGCAAYYAAQRGDDAMARQDYEDAVAQYRDAVARRPGKAEYQQKLLEARQRRAVVWLTQAAQLANSGDLNRALARCEQVLADLPDHSDARTLCTQMTQQRAAAAAQFDAAKSALVSRRNLPQAVEALRALLPLAPTFPDLPVFAQRAESMLLSLQLDEQGAGQLGSQKYEAALASFVESVRLDSGNGAAQAHLEQARAEYSSLLDKTATDALLQRRYSVAVPALQRATELWASGRFGPSDAPRAEQFRQRARAVLASLARRARTLADQADRRGLLGLSWVERKVAALLEPAESGQAAAAQAPLPDLEPLLRYRVAVQIDGDPLLSERLQPQLLAELGRYGGENRVDLVPAPNALATLYLRLGQPSLETQPGRVEVRSRRYVSRIDIQPNPRFRRLVLRVEELTAQLQQLDGAVASAGAQAEKAARRERYTHQAEQRARAVRESSEQRYRQAASYADDLERRVFSLESDLGSVEQDLARVARDLREARDPGQRRSLEEQRSQLRIRQSSLQRQLGDVRNERVRAVSTADRLRLEQRGDFEVRARDSEHDEAERVAQHAQLELNGIAADRDRVASELAETRSALSQTSETIEVPIEADYEYSESFFSRIASVEASLRLGENGAAQPLLNAPVRGQSRVEDFRRDEHRVPGAPDLYIAPHPARFPIDEDMVTRALAALAKETSEQLKKPLTGHGLRFLRAAASLAGDARLNALALAHHASAQILEKDALVQPRQEIEAKTGLNLSENRVNLAVFDGQ